jgi:hypothetical protein
MRIVVPDELPVSLMIGVKNFANDVGAGFTYVGLSHD